MKGIIGSLPLIDREHELKTLTSYMEKTLDGAGQVVILKGETGVGKSLLIEHFIDICKKKGFHILKANCLYYESGDPYRPLLDAMGETWISLESNIQYHGTPVSMSLMGAGHNGNGITGLERRRLLFQVITDMIMDFAREKPLLIFLDDLQWIDEGTAELLLHIALQAGDERVMIIGAYRPEDMPPETSPHPLNDILKTIDMEDFGGILSLNTLNFLSSCSLIRILFRTEDIPDEFLKVIFHATGGNPFYIIETIKTMIHSGATDPSLYKFDAEKALSDIEIPGSIKDVVKNRIGGLSKEEKKLLMYASTIGNEFEFELLERVMDDDVISILDTIDSLLSKGVIQDVERKRETYRFCNYHMHAVMCGEMNKSRTRVLNLRVGEILENLQEEDPDKYCYRLCRHFHLGKDDAKTYHYSILAAEKAYKEYAVETSLKLYKRALKAFSNQDDVEDPTRTYMELNEKIGTLSEEVNDWGCARDSFSELKDMAAMAGDSYKEAFALRQLGFIYFEMLENVLAKISFERCLDKGVSKVGLKNIAESHRGLGYIYWREGAYDDAVKHHRKAMLHAREAGDEHALSKAYLDMGNIHAHRGENKRAIEHYIKSIQTLEREGDLGNLARAYNNMGDQYMKMKEWEKAMECFDRCKESAVKIGNRKALAWSYFNRGEALLGLGNIKEARRYAEMAKNIMVKSGDRIGLSGSYRVIGMIDRKEGKIKSALTNLEKGLEEIRDLELPFNRGELMYEMGMAYYHTGDLDTTREIYVEISDELYDIGARQLSDRVEERLLELLLPETTNL